MRWYEDTEYQLMCEKAEEIQEKWEYPKEGDFVISPRRTIELITEIHFQKFTRTKYKDFIWLPSQEDLQEMVKQESTYFTLMDFCNFVDTGWGYKVCNEKECMYSMEQLWLAFVYHELYDKKWNPEKKEWEVRT